MLFGISANPDEAGAQLARLLSGELLGLVGGTVGLDTLRLEQGPANAPISSTTRRSSRATSIPPRG